VTVLGSLNMDISVTVPALPGPGETVLGGAASFTPGGKGANQAVAAARLGAEVRMVGCVGQDDFGSRLTEALLAEGIDASAVSHLPQVPTGLAMITVDASGENTITVAPGANHEVGGSLVDSLATEDFDALVISAEIGIPMVRRALERSRRPEVLCLLNLAPAPPEQEAKTIVAAGVDWLVVNESEAAAILGSSVSGLADALRAAVALVAAGARNAVVTAGAQGVALAGPAAQAESAAATVAGFSVTAVDSVGAGDTFVGALAAALAAGVAPLEAVRAAAAAGAAAATRHGAQAAMPGPADIFRVTGLRWPLA
jgi:ribokinase